MRKSTLLLPFLTILTHRDPTAAGRFEAYLPNEIKVGDEFWDFLGGDNSYEQLLDVFEDVGIELRPEIDARFATFRS
jgi:hypothetical protein